MSAAHGLRLGAGAGLLELLRDPPCSFRFATSNASTSPAFAHAFLSGASFFSSSATSASTVPGAGEARYSSIAFTSAAFQPFASRPSALRRPSTPSTTTSRASPKRLPALQSADGVGAGRSCALTSSDRLRLEVARAAARARSRSSGGRCR